MTNKKIAFVTCGYPIDTSTMLINSIALLSEHNQVEVVVSPADSRRLRYPDWMQPLLVQYPLNNSILSRRLHKFCRSAAKRLFRRSSSSFAWWAKNTALLMFSRWFKRYAAKMRYDLIIAVECDALIAVVTAPTPGCDLLYYNMELMDWTTEQSGIYPDKFIRKKLEHAALRSAAHVFITSRNRAKIFSEINGYPLEKISILPVVPRKISSLAKSSYFRDLFAIPKDMHIAAYAGSFTPWAMCLDIINSMTNWPENCALVMHTWSEDAPRSDYFQQMRKAAQGRPVYFSIRYLSYSELATVFSSADVGLLYYEAIDANFTEILFSSNKFGEYMAAGLPVICSPFPSLVEFVARQNIGCAVPVQEIGPALRKITADLDAYRARVEACRNEYFEFEKYFYPAFAAYTASI